MTRFAFVDREKAHYAIAVLCRLLKVSTSGYYAWLLAKWITHRGTHHSESAVSMLWFNKGSYPD